MFLQFGQAVLPEVFVGFVTSLAGAADFSDWFADADAAVPTTEVEHAGASEREVRIAVRLRETGNRFLDRCGVVDVVADELFEDVARVARQAMRCRLLAREMIEQPNEVDRQADADQAVLVQERDDVIRFVPERRFDHARRPFLHPQHCDVLPGDDVLTLIIRFGRHRSVLNGTRQGTFGDAE